MQVLATGWIVAAAACASLALLQLLIWLRLRGDLSLLIFAVTTLSAAGVAVGESRMSSATSVDALVTAFGLTNSFIAAMLIGLAWFIVTYADAESRVLAWVATAGWLASTVADWLSAPDMGAQVVELQYLVTTWGETVAIPPPSPMDSSVLLANIAVLAVLALAVQQAWRTYKVGERHKSLLIGSIAVFLFLALIQATLVDLGLLGSPYITSYLFLAIVLVTNYRLAAGVASAAFLSEAARTDERRWHSLLEGMGLLVVRIRPDGIVEYANPSFYEVSGFSSDRVLGVQCHELFAEEDRERVQKGLGDLLAGHTLEQQVETRLLTNNGEPRVIVWRGAVVRNREGEISEVVSIGADRTARLQSERARDLAIAQITSLKEQLEEENLYLKEEIKSRTGTATEIVGESEALTYVLYRMEQVAPTDITVLIQGETGVGKELIAQALHENSSRSHRPLVRLNCATLGANLVESELFGHIAGAFTDAKVSRKGRFELADGGTLFLDEVSELPLEMQPKLLRVLQEGEFEPVGSSRTRKSDVRLITATNRKLREEVEAGRFREDLFYRLHVYPITVPPLRERAVDIPLLVEHFLPRIAARCGRKILEVPAGVLHELAEYTWPGNVRQLHNVLEEAVVASSDGVLRLVAPLGTEAKPTASGVLMTLSEMTREHILAVLKATDGQIAGRGGAAEILDLHPNTLRSRMKKLGLSPQDVFSLSA